MSSESDLPALTQPTLPPPAVESSSPATSPTQAAPRGRTRLVGIGAVGVAVASVGAYAVFASQHGETSALAGTATPARRPADLLARIERTMDSLPPGLLDRACTDSEPRIPVILHSTLLAHGTGSPNRAIESSLFVTTLSHDGIDTRLATVPRVAVVRTFEVIEPHASVGSPTPGRYEGQLAILDAANGAPLCHTRVVAWSSSSVATPGIAERALRDDFAERIRTAISEGARRLQLTLEL
jgi:hypothetical protein